jgi:hypothetical protein
LAQFVAKSGGLILRGMGIDLAAMTLTEDGFSPAG